MRSIAARVGGLLGLVSAVVVGAALIEHGLMLGWSLWARFAFVSTLIAAVVGAEVLLHSLLSPEDSDLGPELHSDRRGNTFRKGLLIATGIILAFVAAALALDKYANIPFERTALVSFGIGLAWCTLRKPWWFWQHWKAHFLRQIIGDRATTIVYLVVAALLFYAGLFADTTAIFK